MAIKIPTIEQKRGVSEESGLATVPNIPDQSGVIAGQALQGFGAEVQDASMRIKNRQDYVTMSNLMRRASVDLVDITSDFNSTNDTSNTKSNKKYFKSVNDYADNVINNADLTGENKEELRIKFDSVLADFESKQVVNVNNNQVKAVYDNIGDSVSGTLLAIQSDEINHEEGLNNISNEINDFYKQGLISNTQALDLIDIYQSKVGVDVVRKFIDNNKPEEAAAFLAKNPDIRNSMTLKTRDALSLKVQKLKTVNAAEDAKERKAFISREKNVDKMFPNEANKGRTPGQKLYITTGNEKLMQKEMEDDVVFKEDETNLKADKIRLSASISALDAATEMKTQNIEEVIIQMSEMGQEGVDDYRAGDENTKKKILMQAKAYNEEQDYAGAATGTVGWFAEFIGGTAASNLEASLESLKANVAFDKLTAMRQESKTGGAVGQLTDKEREALSAIYGKLDISAPRTLYQSLLNLEEITKQINERQQEVYKETYGEDYKSLGSGETPTTGDAKPPKTGGRLKFDANGARIK